MNGLIIGSSAFVIGSPLIVGLGAVAGLAIYKVFQKAAQESLQAPVLQENPVTNNIPSSSNLDDLTCIGSLEEIQNLGDSFGKEVFSPSPLEKDSSREAFRRNKMRETYLKYFGSDEQIAEYLRLDEIEMKETGFKLRDRLKLQTVKEMVIYCFKHRSSDLILENLNITRLPSCLRGFTHLKSLYLKNNSIQDISILEELAGLETVSLISNQILEISSLKGLANLRKLWLDDNFIEDISALGDLKNLRFLSLGNNLVQDVSPLSKVPDLQELHLFSNNIQDIFPLKVLSRLYKLDLSFNQIQDVKPLSRLYELNSLNLTNNRIEDGSSLFTLIKLRELDMQENKIKSVKFIQGFSKLKRLCLKNNLIEDRSPIDKLANSPVVFLKGNPVFNNPLETKQSKPEKVLGKRDELHSTQVNPKSITKKDFFLSNDWIPEDSDERVEDPETGDYVSRWLIDATTRKRYLNEPEKLVRLKCLALVLGSGTIQVIGALINTLFATFRLVTFYHLWKSKALDEDSISFTADLARTIFGLTVPIAMTLTALYGLYSPYDGRKVYGTIERAFYGYSMFAPFSLQEVRLAPCFQPEAGRHLFGGDLGSMNAW